MATPTIVQVDWAKGKCPTFVLSSDGVFSGYMHPEKHTLLSMTGGNNEGHRDNKMMFLPCHGRGSIRWAPCALLKQNLKAVSPNTQFDCQLVLSLGVTRGEGGSQFHYLVWKESLEPHTNLGEALNS
mmetsp:Transcript_14800/g.25266  ORF Transcript_14800/g.25266 Transcript_14800/m.25266 type:complete len:127 (-) Transcript_14800:13-393(-)